MVELELGRHAELFFAVHRLEITGLGAAVTPRETDVILAADVGGTTTDAATVALDGSLVGEVRRLTTPADGDAATILEHLTGLVADLRRSADAAGRSPIGMGIAVPGPFDYERGVSWMRHKLPAIRGLDLRRPVEAAADLPVSFCNDADAFALGAWWREHPQQSRLVGVTIGTGLGAGFVVDGRLVGEEEGTPPGAEVWDAPWGDGVLEDAVSGRALEEAHARRGGTRLAARDVAALARDGDPTAVAAFSELGTALGEGLAATIAGFRPTIVVCGGQVARSFELFGPQAQAVYARGSDAEVPFRAASSERLSLLGAARHAAAGRAGGRRP